MLLEDVVRVRIKGALRSQPVVKRLGKPCMIALSGFNRRTDEPLSLARLRSFKCDDGHSTLKMTPRYTNLAAADLPGCA